MQRKNTCSAIKTAQLQISQLVQTLAMALENFVRAMSRVNQRLNTFTTTKSLILFVSVLETVTRFLFKLNNNLLVISNNNKRKIE